MKSVPQPLLPERGDRANKLAKKEIDIPYNRWENRRRRALISFIKITVVMSLLTVLALFASGGDVELNMVLSGLQTVFGLAVQILAVLIGVVAQFGLIFWFLGRPKVEKQVVRLETDRDRRALDGKKRED